MGTYLGILLVSGVTSIFQVFAIGDFGFLWQELIGGLLFLYLPYHVLILRQPLRIPGSHTFVFSIFTLGSLALSALVVAYQGDGVMSLQSFKTMLHFFYVWLIAVVIWMLPITKADIVTALRIFVYIGLLIGIYAIYQLFARLFDWWGGWIDVTNASFKKGANEYDLPLGQLALQFSNFFRATSIFSEPSALAAFEILILSIIIVPLVLNRPGILKTRWASLAHASLAIVAIFLTFSMTGVMLTIVMLLYLVIQFTKQVFRSFWRPLLILTSVLFIADAVVDSFAGVSVVDLFGVRLGAFATGKAFNTESEENIIGESSSQRKADYEFCLELWKRRPITGVGPGNFAHYEYSRNHTGTYPATMYLNAMAELGTIGALSIVSLMISLVVAGNRAAAAWFARSSIPDAQIDAFVGFIVLNPLCLFFIGFTGNNLVSLHMWLQLVIIAQGIYLVREEMGLEKPRVWRLYGPPQNNAGTDESTKTNSAFS